MAASGAPTEQFAQANVAAPQIIPPRGDAPAPPRKRRSWGWVIALVLVIAALVAVAILGTVLLTRDDAPKVSQEDRVRTTIQNFDTAIQKGDLATLRSITCGETADSYIKYDDARWKDIHARVAAARQYPVVASIDQVVVNNDGTPRPTSRRSWRSTRPRDPRAASIWSSATSSGRSARRPSNPSPPGDLCAVSIGERTKPHTSRWRVGGQPAVTLRPVLCRSLQASTTRSVIDASAFFR